MVCVMYFESSSIFKKQDWIFVLLHCDIELQKFPWSYEGTHWNLIWKQKLIEWKKFEYNFRSKKMEHEWNLKFAQNKKFLP